jgi:hypothetical protein
MSMLADVINVVSRQPLDDEDKEGLLQDIIGALQWDVLHENPKKEDGSTDWEQTDIEERREIKRMLGHAEVQK